MGFWDTIKSWASNAWNGIKNVAGNVWNTISPVVRAIPLVGDKIATGVESVGNAIDTGARGLGALASGNLSGAFGAAKDAYNGIKDGIGKLTSLKNGGMVPPRKHFQK